jgi:AmiR/NasT family two-component response regulator
MMRDHLRADEAFEALRRQSQNTNVKLHIIAERIINGGLLDVGQSRSSQRRP